MKKFEYKVERLHTFTSAIHFINEMGRKGWEVCAFNSDNSEILLKREIENEQ